MSNDVVGIRLGNVVYQVERKFVGTVSREDILRRKLEEDIRSSPFQIEIKSTIERLRKDKREVQRKTCQYHPF